MKSVCFTLFLASLPVAGFAQPIEPAVPKSLPKVVLVGDSIRMSYAAAVAKQLDGTAVVISSKSNGGDSNNVLKHLQAWVIAEQPDVVHFNCGIHDTKKFAATGKYQVPPEQYEANLRQIVTRILKETSAIVVLATTTPILDDRAAKARFGRDYQLLDSSVKQYNTIAKRVMQELKVSVNDLHTTMSKPQPPATLTTMLGTDGVHLTPTARELLGATVATTIRQHLPKVAR